MCFLPRQRAIFGHRNFKKWSAPALFCAFSLENVLLATAACNFRHRNFKKWSAPALVCTFPLENVLLATASVQLFDIGTSKSGRNLRCFVHFHLKMCSRHSGLQFLISPLTTWGGARHFNEPTFRLTRHTNHLKNTAFRDFSNIWRRWIFFLTFALLHLLSLDFTSSHLCFGLYSISFAFHLLFNSPYCRKFTI